MVGLKPIGSIARNWNPRSSNLVYKNNTLEVLQRTALGPGTSNVGPGGIKYESY